MADRYERLWREYWRETHKPDARGEYYFDRHDREKAHKADETDQALQGSKTHDR